MKKHRKAGKMTDKPSRTIGIDLGDRFCSYCILNRDGEMMEKGRPRTEASAFRRQFAGEERMRVAMECGIDPQCRITKTGQRCVIGIEAGGQRRQARQEAPYRGRRP